MYKKILTLFFLSAFVSAQVVKLHIDNLDILEHSERFGDEVFLYLLESDADKLNETYFPQYPFYFRDGHLENFQTTSIWQKDIIPGQEVKLFLSFIEKDAAPWDIDDLIGQVDITLQGNAQGIESSWELVSPQENTVVLSSTSDSMSLEFSNNNGRYLLDISLEYL
jgi:hypothetical protein